jgi:hypothetical protein
MESVGELADQQKGEIKSDIEDPGNRQSIKAKQVPHQSHQERNSVIS